MYYLPGKVQTEMIRPSGWAQRLNVGTHTLTHTHTQWWKIETCLNERVSQGRKILSMEGGFIKAE